MDQVTIATLEQRYQELVRDFQSGQISQAAFLSAADDLYFQDERGRYWAIGLQSGAWHYHDGQAWQPADPRQAARLSMVDAHGGPAISYPEAGPAPAPIQAESPPKPERPTGLASAPLTVPARSFLVMGVALVTILALLALPAGGAPPLSGPAVAPSPRPPLGGGASGGGDGDDQGAILGTVTDLSTGQPGENIEVVVSGYPPVRTNSQGQYSITGLPAAEYVVSLELRGQGSPAQGPVYVVVDGQNSTTVDLAYHSQAQPSLTETPQPSAAQAEDESTGPPPPTLPESGAGASRIPLAVTGIGLLLTIVGGLLSRRD
jgi:hypothetical protein